MPWGFESPLSHQEQVILKSDLLFFVTETLNKSSAAGQRVFCPGLRYENKISCYPAIKEKQ